jgi:putative DNA primase/helicase
MTRGEVEKVKAFITRSTDRFRPSYGRRVIEVPRQAVFFGSTNALEYLKDETGGRRFWPVRCGRIDHDAIARDRDQLWAEAVALYNAGEPWWLTDEALLLEAHGQQEDRYQGDRGMNSLPGIVRTLTASQLPKYWRLSASSGRGGRRPTRTASCGAW